MDIHYGFTSPPLPEWADPINRHDAVLPVLPVLPVDDYREFDEFLKPPSTPPRRYGRQMTISPYVIYLDRLLGQGATADVFLCMDTISGELRAVKRIDKRKLNDKALDMVIKEYGIVTSLDHVNIINAPLDNIERSINIIRFYDYKEFNRYIYIFMDYYPEGDLITYEEQFAYINECTAWMVFKQVLDALVYLHERHVIHRDIKLENILLKDSTDMTVALADFGFSEILPVDDPYVKDAKGTPNYIAPEVFTGEPYDGYKVDIWALGITLYAMVCGYMPFEDRDPRFLVKKITYNPLEFPRHVTSECRSLLRELLTRDPSSRITLGGVYDSEWYTYWKQFMSHSKCSPNPKKLVEE